MKCPNCHFECDVFYPSPKPSSLVPVWCNVRGLYKIMNNEKELVCEPCYKVLGTRFAFV